MTLDEIGLETSTDKNSRYHTYLDTYDELFKHVRRKPITLLEQGVLAGDSLKMFDTYFTHPKSRICGLDIEKRFHPGPGSRITTFLGNQNDTTFLQNVINETGPLDICICDAGHFYRDQVTAFEFLWPHVKPGGYYSIEDIHTSWHPQHSEGGRIIDYLTQIAGDVQDHGETWHGKPLVTDKWYSVDWILFRKGMAILKKRKT
jgi:hypothetical protein